MRILQVGCESGYSSALMAQVGAEVFALEALSLLAKETRQRLDELGFQNILIRRGPEEKGWTEHAPYDAIIVLSAFVVPPTQLIAQLLHPNGRMVVPIGDAEEQVLTLWEARADTEVSYELEACRFCVK